ncbi:MBL fold metallo-hydrolase [Flexivirga oryzae]|uniref:MBL fold metallo-hydrolase n=1 Tax=Flexivirga oryzae TaxID=1794944 RepID=UPI001C86240B
MPELLTRCPAGSIDAVFVSHGHPDHCADLNPLLRARWLGEEAVPPLRVFAPAGALDAVLALDRPGMLDDAIDLHEFDPGERWEVDGLTVETRLLPHWTPNAGVRISGGEVAVAYSGDCGPTDALAELATGADLFVCDSSYVDDPPEDSVGLLGTARSAGIQAARAGVRTLLLTHLMPGTDPLDAQRAAERQFAGRVAVAQRGTELGSVEAACR